METFGDQDRGSGSQNILGCDDCRTTEICGYANPFQDAAEGNERFDIVESASEIVFACFDRLCASGENLLSEHDNVCFLILSNEFDVVEIGCVESCIQEILFREFLECFFVEDVLEMFQLGVLAFVAWLIACHNHRLTVSANCRTTRSVSASCLVTRGADRTVDVRTAQAAPMAESFMSMIVCEF